jgi:FAD/FMN-containing dehydrogenase
MFAKDLEKLTGVPAVGDSSALKKYSRDASLFEVRPAAVAFPRDSLEVAALVNFVRENKKRKTDLSLTVRAAGTCMSGGPLGESIILDLTKHFKVISKPRRLNKVDGRVVAEVEAQPGVFYRDFEKITLREGYLMPSYPASREMCALGGMLSNNAGGEKSLKYGKTENFVRHLKIVLADGKEHLIKPLNSAELLEKTHEVGWEGEMYRRISKLVKENYEILKIAKPKVLKNSTGYNLWNIWDKEKNIFDLTKLFVGAQGTLGVVTEATWGLVKAPKYSAMAVIFLRDWKSLPAVLREVSEFQPSSMESFDNHTFKLALKFWRGFLGILSRNPITLLLGFWPEFKMVLRGGLPKLTLLVEFEEEEELFARRKAEGVTKKMTELGVTARFLDKTEAKKYWLIRRESFNLLRHKFRGLQTAPFIDDLIVPPARVREFLPAVYKILDREKFFYTVAGHVGEGNFHIIPLMKLGKDSERAKIRPVMKKIHALVFRLGGSMSGEHNDGLIRSPDLQAMYGERIYKLFEETKNIFDPQNIFNPHKKVGASWEYAEKHFRRD